MNERYRRGAAHSVPRVTRGTMPLFGLAIAGFVAAFALGAYVTSRGTLGLDVAARGLRGEAVPLAEAFTQLGYWPALSVFGALALAATYAAGVRTWTLPALVVSHGVSQAALAAFKLLFHRVRPDYWLVHHETDSSYPSGHSATAITFYLALFLLVNHADWARGPRLVATVALALCVAGIPWSRLALGAHYATDVLGGIVFGGAWLALSIGAWRIVAFRAASILK